MAAQHDHGSSGDLAADRRYAWGMAALKDGCATEAVELLEQALAIAPAWAPAWLGLGDAAHALGHGEEAARAWRQALGLDPGDVLGAGPRLARLGALDPAAAMTPAYVAALFDDYAPRFEAHLTGVLDYRGPDLVLQALDAEAPGRRFPRVLDAGCGTGLMGEALRTRAGWLGGCDLSRAMVAKARAKGCYDKLDVAEMGAWLDGMAEGWADLLTAADVLVYCGDLKKLFASAARVLGPEGLFAFTAQTFDEGSEGAGYAMGADLRFRHGAGYLRAVSEAAGLALVRLDPAVVRRDRGAGLPGFVGVARRG